MSGTFQAFVVRTNLPNKITIGRVVMIFIFLIACNVDESIADPAEKQLFRAIGLGFAILAGLTDLLDGWMARRYQVVTDFGKLMDPLADKIFMATTFIVLVSKGILPGWVAVIVLSREFLVTGLRLLATNKGEVIPADTTGKLKTFLQMMFLVLGGVIWVGWVEKADIRFLWMISYWAIVLVTAYSGINYFVRFRHLYWSST
jgi:CDP-diacylglycerol--glycerol-3-phosphate 3-phosphatidyltransferase